MKGDRISDEERDKSLRVAFDLLNQGRTYEEVHVELEAERLYVFSVNSLRTYYTQWKRGKKFQHIVIEPPTKHVEHSEHEMVLPLRSEQEERSERQESVLPPDQERVVEPDTVVPISSEHDDRYEHYALDDHIRQIAREVLEEMMDNMQNLPSVMNIIDTPPEPKTIKGEGRGRREDRDYIKISATIDRTLWDLFVQERDRLKVSTGRMMDIILWRAFGRPRLSYEHSEDNE